jgi:hypothetical protein
MKWGSMQLCLGLLVLVFIIMKNNNIIKLDVILIFLGMIIIFLSKKDVLPLVVSAFYFIGLSFYFFPFKLIMFKRENFEIISDILISITSIIAIIVLYRDVEYLAGIFGFLNFGFIMYYAFFILNKQNLNKTYRLLILSHFLITATLNNVA